MISRDTAKMNFTPERRDRLRAAYLKAVDDGRDEFVFEGYALLTEYARYMLEYLDNMYGPKQ